MCEDKIATFPLLFHFKCPPVFSHVQFWILWWGPLCSLANIFVTSCAYVFKQTGSLHCERRKVLLSFWGEANTLRAKAGKLFHPPGLRDVLVQTSILSPCFCNLQFDSTTKNVKESYIKSSLQPNTRKLWGETASKMNRAAFTNHELSCGSKEYCAFVVALIFNVYFLLILI